MQNYAMVKFPQVNSRTDLKGNQPKVSQKYFGKNVLLHGRISGLVLHTDAREYWFIHNPSDVIIFDTV